MLPSESSQGMQERIRGLVKIRDCTQKVINLQLEEYPDDVIEKEQAELNRLYDLFTKKHGLINSRSNKRAFSQDSSYCLLCSLEKLDDEGNFVGKADMFTKRTIKKAEVITSVDTASEALAVSEKESQSDIEEVQEMSEVDTGDKIPQTDSENSDSKVYPTEDALGDNRTPKNPNQSDIEAAQDKNTADAVPDPMKTPENQNQSDTEGQNPKAQVPGEGVRRRRAGKSTSCYRCNDWRRLLCIC